MNIFYLDKDPVKAAEYHVDRHVVKMIQETAQILSTAHRVIQPAVYRNLCTMGWSGRLDHTERLLPGESIRFELKNFDLVSDVGWKLVNKQAMLMTHANHPCSIWARSSIENYMWLYELFEALSVEKLHRYPTGPNNTRLQYGKFLSNPPTNLKTTGFTNPPLAMPARYKASDVVESYQRYYVGDKFHFAKWTNRSIPKWFLNKLSTVWEADPDSRVMTLLDPKKSKKTQITLNHVKKYLPDVYNRLVV